MDVAETTVPLGLASAVEPSKMVVPGPGVLCVAEEVRRVRFVLFSIVDKGAPVDVMDGSEAIAETLPRSISISFSQHEVSLFIS